MVRIDFSTVEEPKGYEPIPKGKYNVRVTACEADVVSSGPNEGCPLYKIEMTVLDGEYEDRRVFDNMSLIPPKTENGREKKGTYWRAQQALKATGIDASAALDLDDLDDDGLTFEDHLMGQELVIAVDVEDERTDPNSGKTYKAKNKVRRFESANSEAGSDLP